MSIMNLPGLYRIYIVKRYSFLPFLYTFFLTCLPLLSYSPAAHATTFPNISGTFIGTIPGVETGCGPTEQLTGNFSLSFTQNDGTFSGSGINNGTEPGGSFADEFTFTGTIDTAGNFNATLSGTTDGGTAPIDGNFSGTLSGDSMSISFNYSDLASPFCNWTYSGTLTRTSADLIINPEITPSNVLTTPLLLNTQVKAITTDLGNRISDVLKGFASEPRRTASGIMFQESGLNAGDSMLNYGIWGSYSYSDFGNSLSSTAFDGSRHNVLAGVDISPVINLVIGLALGYENTDIDTRFNRGNLESDGYTVAPYIGYLLSDNWSIDAAVGYSRVDFDQYRTDGGMRITSSPSSNRWFGTLNVNGFTYWNNWFVSGRIGILHARDIQEGFTESDGTFVPEFTNKLGQWSVGGEAAYSFGEFEPFARVAYERDFSMTEIAVTSGPQPSNDRDNFLFGAGLRYFGANGLTGNLEWNKRIDRDDFNEDTFSLTVRMDF